MKRTVTPRMRATASAFALVVAFALVATAGCAPRGSEPGPTVPAGIELGPLTGEARRTLPADFPPQVPVVAGTVTASKSVKTGTRWTYSLETTGPADAVAGWYRRVYTGADWEAVEDSSGDGPGGVRQVVLVFRKGSIAESRLTVTDAADGRAAVDGEVSVGEAFYRPPQ